MREILFRGKRLDNKEWVEGYYFSQNGRGIDGSSDSKIHFIMDKYGTQIFDPTTVGQWTGLTDKNGAKIWEGDLLRFPPKDTWEKKNYMSIEVFWHDNDYSPTDVGLCLGREKFHGSLCGGSYMHKLIPKWTQQMIVIGNIHDNPELITCKTEN